MSPYLFLIGVGGTLLAIGGSKSKPKKKSGGGDTPLEAGIAVLSGLHPIERKPWFRCDPPPGSPKGTYAMYDENLSCSVFWRPETAEVVVGYIRSELDKLPKSEQDTMCSPDNCETDPYSMGPEPFCDWVEDPKRMAFIKRIVVELYPQLKDQTLPPPDHDPYFPRMVYMLIAGTFVESFCGFNLVT